MNTIGGIASKIRCELMSKVAVIHTTPNSAIEDYGKIMDLLEYKKFMNIDLDTIIKINLSWSLFYPACSTPPWQLEGLIKKLQEDGYKNLLPVENQTVVTHPWKGAYGNKWLPIMEKYGIDFRPLTNEEWVPFKPKADMLGMYDLFGDEGIIVPKIYIGANIVHLPTIKTHGHTTTTGAIKNAFGGLIPKYRHHSHKILDEILVDLLAIQKELHPGILAVMDGTVAGNGAGPRVMEPVIANLLLASEDQVAIDAISAKIMGFDPLKIRHIQLAHEEGLGIGDFSQIDIIGLEKQELDSINLRFKAKRSLVVRWDQRIRNTTYKHKALKPFHWLFFYSPWFRMFILASAIYHDWIWYPIIGKRRINKFRRTEWGKLFDSYDFGDEPKDFPPIKNWNRY